MVKDKPIQLSEETLGKFRTFTMRMASKYADGVRKHGTKIVINPIDEAQAECLDLANYAMMTFFKLEGLRKKVDSIQKDQG